MKECKNCGINIKEKNTYCSLTCRNIYVNKNLRDYTKNSGRIKELSKEKYSQNPKKCKKCELPIDYKDRTKLYCSDECRNSSINRTNRKGLKYKMTQQGRENIIRTNLERIGVTKEFIEYNKTPNKCCNCNNLLSFKKRNNKYCCIDCRRMYERNLMSDYKQYKQDTKFNFNLSDFPSEFEFSLIEEYGWYKPVNRGNNLGGVSRDHIYSVNEGFKNKIDPKIISHPANCKLMVHNENISKNKKSNITIDELLKKIEDWDKKYLLD
jgi:hypothetical protein